jgi:hypothetical protein
LDADEEVLPIFWETLPEKLLANIDGYYITRCNLHFANTSKEKERKTRLWRSGRALANAGFGSEFIPSCPKCWKDFSDDCVISHDKTSSERHVDGQRYKQLCEEQCEKAQDSSELLNYPDCHVYPVCKKIFIDLRTTGTVQPISERTTAELTRSKEACWEIGDKTEARQSQIERTAKVLCAGERLLEDWDGQMIFFVNAAPCEVEAIAATAVRTCSQRCIHPDMDSMSLPPNCGGLHKFPREASYEQRLIKAVAIERLIKENDASVYFETQHNFDASYFDIVLREFSHLTILIVDLQSDAFITAKDLLGESNDSGDVSLHQKKSSLWLQPNSPNTFSYSEAATIAAGDDKLLQVANYVINMQQTIGALQKVGVSKLTTFHRIDGTPLNRTTTSVLREIGVSLSGKEDVHTLASCTSRLNEAERQRLHEFLSEYSRLP